MSVDELNKLWETEASKHPILGDMTFENGSDPCGEGTRPGEVAARHFVNLASAPACGGAAPRFGAPDSPPTGDAGRTTTCRCSTHAHQTS